MNQERKAFQSFGKLLNERVNNNIYSTEDSIRYLFFEEYLSEMCTTKNDFIMELPLESPILNADCRYLYQTNNSRPELDALFFTQKLGKVAIEFKYHRKTTDSSFPHPDAAGSLFNDIHRLSFIKGCSKKYFVYVTDGEMDKYLDNNKRPSHLRRFYTMNCGDNTKIDDILSESGIPKTLIKSSQKSFVNNTKFSNYVITCIYRQDINNQHIRVYEIQ